MESGGNSLTDMERIPSAASLLEHTDFLKTLARSLILHDAEADDFVQQAYVAVLRSRRPIRHLRAWLAGTVRNLVRMSGRARARRDQRERAAACPEAVPPPLDTIIRLELQRLVVAAVLRLDEPYRTAIVLRHFEGLSVRAIARRERVASKTIHTRLRRARDQLRARLDRTHHGERQAWALALVPLAARGAPPLVAGTLVAAASIALIAAAVLIGTVPVGSHVSTPSRAKWPHGSMPSRATPPSGSPDGFAVLKPSSTVPTAARMLIVVVVAKESGEPLPDMEVWGAGPSGTSKTQRADGRGRVRFIDDGRTTMVYARGSGRLVTGVHVAAGADTVRVELTKGILVRGRVIDAVTGEPVRATVDVVEAETGTTLAETQSTDGAGRFEITAVRPGVPFFVGVRGPGFYPVEVRERRTCAEPDLEIVVGDGGVIEGVLTDAQGKPVFSFPVVVAPILDLDLLGRALSSSAGPGGFRYTPIAWTDETGHFRLRGVPLPGTYVVGATTKERSVATDDLALTPERPRRWCELSLADAPQLEVIVKTPDGKKVHSNDVTLHDPRSNWGAVAEILDEPREGFLYCPPRAGVYEIRVDARGYLPLREQVEVAEGALKKHTVTLDPGRALEVIVRDAGGRPVEGVFVRVKGTGSVRWTTGDDGRWRMSGLEAREYTVTVGDPRGRYAPLVCAGVRPDAAPAELVVYRAARIVGQVEDAVALWASVAWQDDAGEWHSKWHQLRRDVGGRVTIAPVVAHRPLRLVLRPEGAAPSHFDHPGLEPGDEWRLGRLRWASGLSLVGTVVGEDGAPVAGAELSLRTRQTATAATARTDVEGRFFLKHLPAEPATIEVRADEYVLRTVSLTNVGHGLPAPIRLERGGLLVVLRLRNGRPVSCGVRGRRADGDGEQEWKARRYEDNGHVRVRLRPGFWRLAYNLDGTWHDAQEVRIKEGGTTHATLRVR